MNITESQRLDKQEVTNETISNESEAMKRIFNEKKKKLNLSQRELALRFKVKPPSIFAYLNGQTPLNIKFASFFAEQLEVSIDEFSPRMALEYGKITGKIDQESFRYPLLKLEEIENFRELTHQIKNSKSNAESYPTDINIGENGFWVKLESEDMVSYNGGLSFSKGLLLLVSPDEKPQVNELAILKIKYDSSMASSIIKSNDKYIFRAIAHDGENLEAIAFNPKACSITLTDQNAELIGKVVSAFYPPEMFKI